MPKIAFLDTEVQAKTNRILDIGIVNDKGEILHTSSIAKAEAFLKDVKYICGHNIIDHDLYHLDNALDRQFCENSRFIDTLYLSPLLFPGKPYHELVKDDKLQTDELNNPVNDAKKAKDLLSDEITAFLNLRAPLREILVDLLKDSIYFDSFFDFTQQAEVEQDISKNVLELYSDKICHHVDLVTIGKKHPIAFAYALALIDCGHSNSVTPRWVLHKYPEVERIMFLLRSTPCIQGCPYCNKAFNARLGLKTFFGFEAFREFEGEALQEKAVNAALNNKSILAVFPTGGGKSLTFQVPALMTGKNAHALTVVISPLQSLMKDQVDNLEKKGITDAVTINGLLDPIERSKSIERIEDGSASILYISPEALRSKTIERLLLGRNIARFVIDEAHCFSSWGHDFRVDYFYIGDFIQSLQKTKNLEDSIPVSCFTATAKPRVIEDIQAYFRDKLDIDLEVFSANTSRKNLHYKVVNCDNDDVKYQRLRALIDIKQCPTIVYVSRTKRAEELARHLSRDGYRALAFHGKMEANEKTQNQNQFMQGELDIIVATSAFGMGVDKKDVGLVVHYNISDSLENYIQEAGRAGRSSDIQADCYILFNEEDIGKHFVLLNQTKIDKKQIQEIWKAIKDLTRFRSDLSNSALEIARKAGWQDQVQDIETRVKSAIAALEVAGYVKRTNNSPRIYADSILSKNADDAISRIRASSRFSDKEKVNAIRIIKKLIASRSRSVYTDEYAESRVDYISDHLGIPQRDVLRLITLLIDEKILASTKDLAAHFNRNDSRSGSSKKLKKFSLVENELVGTLNGGSKIKHIKEINEQLQNDGLPSNPNIIKIILNFWHVKHLIVKERIEGSQDLISLRFKKDEKELLEAIEKRHTLSKFIIEYLIDKANEKQEQERSDSNHIPVEFSVHELKDKYIASNLLHKYEVSVFDIEEALFYLSRIESLNIDGGFLVSYNLLNVHRKEKNARKQFKDEDYKALKNHYQHKIQQIHIVGEYAKKMIADDKGALAFVDDYFERDFDIFLDKYFPGSRKNDIAQSITPAKFKQLFGELSPCQLTIIKDKDSPYIQVAAGPGSGKTKLLVHKLASIIYLEDVKHEQLLMLTFSRAAVTEFKTRLIKLIGNAALFVDIKTFHSYCFDLLGRKGNIESAEGIIKKAVEKIRNNEVEPGKITKLMLIIDEAQDMIADEYALIVQLIERNPEMRVIAVGDDDQNIYEFRGSDSQYFRNFSKLENAKSYELIENFRSKSNLVDFSNQFVKKIEQRIKVSDIVPVERKDGMIKICSYAGDELITPFVEDLLKTDLAGTSCILTYENNDALITQSLLVDKGLNAKLIQSRKEFNLLHLKEVRYLLEDLKSDPMASTILEEDLTNTEKRLKDKFSYSPNLEICLAILRSFRQTYPKTKYISDLEDYIGESKPEDFIRVDSETILVSTMHKAKGREFDNVFILLKNYDISTDEKKRLLYVAMTRARKNLFVHYNGTYLRDIQARNIEHLSIKKRFNPPERIVLQLSHKDLNLGYFEFVQHRINKLKSGDLISVNEKGFNDTNGHPVAKYSKKFESKIRHLEKKGYSASSAKISFAVYWYNSKLEKELLIVLPEMTMLRK